MFPGRPGIVVFVVRTRHFAIAITTATHTDATVHRRADTHAAAHSSHTAITTTAITDRNIEIAIRSEFDFSTVVVRIGLVLIKTENLYPARCIRLVAI